MLYSYRRFYYFLRSCNTGDKRELYRQMKLVRNKLCIDV